KFSGFNLSSKKAAKKSDNKSTTKKAGLESTHGTELSESFYDKVDSLEIGPSGTSPYYENSNSFESLASSISKIIENQGKLLKEVKDIKAKVRIMETRLKYIEEKLDSNFDFSNDKTFKEDVIKSVSKEILTKAIYPKEELIRAELDRYVRSNYKEDYKKNTPNQWNAYYTRNINGP
ncbi:hypothetical protein C2G38_2052004, partial [Gigaspora rosea]